MAGSAIGDEWYVRPLWEHDFPLLSLSWRRQLFDDAFGLQPRTPVALMSPGRVTEVKFQEGAK